jgi:PEP-CTERM motif
VLSSSIAEVLGTISSGQTEWYQFTWGGGVFDASALIEATGGTFTLLLANGASFTNIINSETLNSADGWAGVINTSLAPGTYGIGLSETGSPDPSFVLSMGQVPEPSSMALVLTGLAGVAWTRLRARKRHNRQELRHSK